MIFADIPYMSERTLNVGADQYEFGYESATFVGEKLGAGAKVILINAIEGNIANDWREDGFNAAIEEQGLEVVGKYNHQWDATTAVNVMTEIINSGVEFDAVLTSQLAESIMTAYDTTGADLPKAIAFGDVAQYGQKMLEINKDEDDFSLTKLSGTEPLQPGENVLLKRLFKVSNTIVLTRANHARIRAAMDAHKTRLEADYESIYFKTLEPAVLAA